MDKLKENNNDLITNSNNETAALTLPTEFTVKKNNKSKKKIVIIISTSVICFLMLILLTAIILLNILSNKIFNNIYIDGINVSGLTKEDAISLIEDNKNKITSHRLRLVCKDMTTEITGNDIDYEYNIYQAVDNAYNIGRFNDIFSNNFNMIKSNFSTTNITCEYTYDSEKLESILTYISSQLPQLVQPSYAIENDNLVITKGNAGLSIKSSEMISEIISALQDTSKSEFSLSTTVIEPENVNINEIRNEIYKEAKDATFIKEPFEIIPHQVGVDFKISIEDATKMLNEDKKEYIIPLAYTTPSKTTDKIGPEAFPDLLSTFQTNYNAGNVNRSTNLKLASNSINGVVVLPGETFSYNKTLGPRTAAAGYKLASIYSGGQEVDGLGGGICQISSVLYNVVLLANLEIVERHNHQFLPLYISAGRDATVVYGALDFQFKNNRKYPIKIESSVSNGIAKMNLYGLKEDNEYEVSLSTTILSSTAPKTVYKNTTSLKEGQTKVENAGHTGYTSVTYKILKQNGKEVSREKLSNDKYDPMKKVVLRGTAKAAQPKQTQSAQATQQSTTQETNTPATNTNTNKDTTAEV